MEKKGISPLIATILLIGFTIVLAVIVLQWGTTFFEDTTDKTGCDVDLNMECAGLDIEFTKAELITNNLTLTIYNKAGVTIDKDSEITVMLGGNKTTASCELNLADDIEPFETGTATDDDCGSSADAIIFIPKIVIDTTCDGYCTSKTFETDLEITP